MAQGIEFDALGKRWSLRMNMAALCHVERRLDTTFTKAVDSLKGGSMNALQVMFGAALGGKLTDDKVCEIIDDLGLEKATGVLGDAVALAFPQDDASQPSTEADAGN